MGEVRLTVWRSFARLLTQFERKKLEPAIALRNAFGVALPLAIGAAMGMPLGGVAVATGALQVAYADGHDPYSRRGFRMLTATMLCALAVVAGGLTGRNHILATIAVVLWGFAAGLVVLLGSEAESLGLISLVTLIIYAAQALTIHRAMISGLLALGGGLIQTAMSVALWPVSRREPERRALANLYSELSNSALAATKSKEAPPASIEITQAHDVVGRLGRDDSEESQRLWSLLNQAERIRLSLLTLARLRNRMARGGAQSADLKIIEQFLQLSSEVLRTTASTLVTHKVSPSMRRSLAAIRQLADRYRHLEAGNNAAFTGAMRVSVRFQLDRVAGQLRSAFRLATNQELTGTELVPKEAMPGWRSRVRDDFSRLRANLSLQSAGFRHAVRLAVTLGIGELMGNVISARRSYWLPMTVALVLKPEFSVTFSRGLLRIAGTVAGLLLSTALFHFLHPVVLTEVALIATFVFLVRWIGPANYGVFAVNVSALVVLLVAFTGVAPQEVIIPRGLMTALGGVTALAAYAVWPTWEASRTSEVLARMLDAYRAYFHSVVVRYLEPENAMQADLHRARLESRRVRSSLEGSVDRLRLEPIANATNMRMLNFVLASSHRFINATMALEGAHENAAVPEAQAMRQFAHDVEKTLELLSVVLRGQHVSPAQFPDLREDHRALLSTFPIREDTLLTEETDRITNSLNTLSEQVLAWRGLKTSEQTPALQPTPA